MNTAIIKYHTIADLKQKYQTKVNEITAKYERDKQHLSTLDQSLPQTKARITRLEKSYKDAISNVNNSTVGMVLTAEEVIMSTELPTMYEQYTGNKLKLEDIRTRKDILEFYVDIDEHKRMWCQNFGSTYKYKCTIDGKGIRYQKSPIITFEDYNG